ncbi:MAG: DUF4157 domain-containing protein, partial [Bacteroidota bacterium]
KEEEESVQAQEEEEAVQSKEEEESVQAQEEEEAVQSKEEEESVQAQEEEEAVQSKEEEESVQAQEEEDAVQSKEEEESVQAQEEEEAVQSKEEEESVQAQEEEEAVQSKEEEESVQAQEEEEAVQSKEEEDAVQSKEEEDVQQKSSGPSRSTRNVESKLGNYRGAGHTMDAQTTAAMEKSFGNDFSKVRIHTGGYAQEMSKQLRARAFTNGHDIYFNSGQYDPRSKEGKHLLAHELTHTIQQKGTIQKKESNDGLNKSTEITQNGFFEKVWNGLTDLGMSKDNLLQSGARASGRLFGSVAEMIKKYLGEKTPSFIRVLSRRFIKWLSRVSP